MVSHKLFLEVLLISSIKEISNWRQQLTVQ